MLRTLSLLFTNMPHTVPEIQYRFYYLLKLLSALSEQDTFLKHPGIMQKQKIQEFIISISHPPRPIMTHRTNGG